VHPACRAHISAAKDVRLTPFPPSRLSPRPSTCFHPFPRSEVWFGNLPNDSTVEAVTALINSAGKTTSIDVGRRGR
jgi:hypothetical protein